MNTEYCDRCGHIPKSATERFRKNQQVYLYCSLCGNTIRKEGHPCQAA